MRRSSALAAPPPASPAFFAHLLGGKGYGRAGGVEHIGLLVLRGGVGEGSSARSVPADRQEAAATTGLLVGAGQTAQRAGARRAGPALACPPALQLASGAARTAPGRRHARRRSRRVRRCGGSGGTNSRLQLSARAHQVPAGVRVGEQRRVWASGVRVQLGAVAVPPQLSTGAVCPLGTCNPRATPLAHQAPTREYAWRLVSEGRHSLRQRSMGAHEGTARAPVAKASRIRATRMMKGWEGIAGRWGNGGSEPVAVGWLSARPADVASNLAMKVPLAPPDSPRSPVIAGLRAC